MIDSKQHSRFRQFRGQRGIGVLVLKEEHDRLFLLLVLLDAQPDGAGQLRPPQQLE